MLGMLATEHSTPRTVIKAPVALPELTPNMDRDFPPTARLAQIAGQAGRDLGRRGATAEAVACFLARWAGYWRLHHLAWVGVRAGKVERSVGISGTAIPDPSSPLQEVLRQTTQALLSHGSERVHWPPAPLADPRHLPADSAAPPEPPSVVADPLRAVAEAFAVPAVAARPIRDQEQIVAWLFLLGDPVITTRTWHAAQSAAWEILGSQVLLGGLAHESTWHRLTTVPSRWLRTQRWWLMAGLCLVVGLAGWPAAYTLQGDCELVTLDRRYAVAPYPGVLKEVLVRPGQQVQTGDLLATMEDRDLRIELAGQSAAHERELNQIRLARAAGDTSQARIAELEASRIAHHLALLEQQLANREIRAPIPGTVVQGDLVELKGSPVDVGQNLFEIAGLDDLVVQVEIPEHQYRYARVGQSVRLQLDAYPHAALSGSIERLLPRAYPRDQRNVFLAEVTIANPQHNLRPGMKGHAKVRGDVYPWAWRWLHYPYEKTRALLGWF
jgi:biotin carboxyl carrier protein